MTRRPASENGRRGSLWDMALVALVVGGGATFVLGTVALGIGALTGRIPLILWLLLALGTLVGGVGLVISLVGLRVQRAATDDSGTDETGQGSASPPGG